MATYPIKMLKDKDGTLFIPLTNSDSVQTSTGDTLENLISSKADESELSHYVTLDTQQTISGKKTYSDKLTISNINNAEYNVSNTSNIQPSVTALSNPPWNRDLWHDHFAFMRYHSLISQETTTDGTTWTTATKDIKDLFNQKDHQSIRILTTSELAYRFTLQNSAFAYSSLAWFEVAVGYTNPYSSFEIWIEHSSDNETWNTCHKSTITGNSRPYFLYNGYTIQADGYLRFTFTKKSNLTTGMVDLSCIKGFCHRKGSQGLGIEYEYPYDWDKDANVLPLGDNVKTLGTASRRWKNIYSETFTGNLTGTATKATGDKNGDDITTTYYKASNPNGYTSNTGTITKVQANGTDVASSGTANIPAASTSVYGVTKLSDATNSTSTTLAATANAVKKAYDLADGKLEKTYTINNSTGQIEWYTDEDKPAINIVVSEENYLDINPSYAELANVSSHASVRVLSSGVSISGGQGEVSIRNIVTPTFDADAANKKYVDDKVAAKTDTKNTAGSTDTSSKIFLIGATSQAANPQTYSDNEVYATSGVLTTKSVQVGGTAATMQYNSTDKCIEFIFA